MIHIEILKTFYENLQRFLHTDRIISINGEISFKVLRTFLTNNFSTLFFLDKVELSYSFKKNQD